MKTLVDAASYLRKSSDAQELSIPQQREEVAKLAELHGYRIIKEYVDEGKSGSLDIDKRKGFLKMVADSNKKEFQVILLWEVARFGRLDPLKAANYKDTLRTNGVFLHTTKEGVIRWDTFTDFVVDVVYSAAANAYSKGLSKDTIRGRLDLLSRGFWPNGKVPYGYDKLYISKEGDRYEVPRTKTFAKGSGWRRHLTINEEEADSVRYIFERFVGHDDSMREIAKKIKATRPDGSERCWTKDTVKAVITNKIYCGYSHIGGLRNRLRAKEAHNRFGYHEQANAIDPIISEEIWQKAQLKIKKNRDNNTRPHTPRSSPLSGILYCGHCGYRLDKKTRTDAKGNPYNYFLCASANKRPGTGCRQWRIQEVEVLPLLIGELIKAVDEAVLEQANSKVDDIDHEQSPLEALQRRLEAVKKKVEQGEENYLMAPANIRDKMLAKLQEWHQEQEELERQQANLSITKGELSLFTRWWGQVKQLITVRPPTWGEQQTRLEALDGIPQEEVDALVVGVNEREGNTIVKTKAGKVFRASPVELPVKPAVMVEQGRFRQLLKDLEFSATVFWKPNPNGRNFDPEKIEIRTRKGVESMNLSECDYHSIQPLELMTVPVIFRVIWL